MRLPTSQPLRYLLLILLTLGFAGAQVLAAPNAQEQALAEQMINASGQGRAFLKYDPILNEVARGRAEDMARRGYFDHVNPDGNGPNYLVEQAGYKLPDWWGDSRSANYIESIAAGNSTASSTWSQFMGSPPHKKHLLAEDSFYQKETSYGVGFVQDPSSEYTYYWVVITAPPTSSLSITAPGAGAKVTSPSVVVSGTAKGVTGVAQVLVRVENGSATGAFLPAIGTDSWKITLSGLKPGTNTIRVKSVDAVGTTIMEATRSVRYVVLSTLNVNVNGSGSVTAAFMGSSQREVGVRYTITAKPASGFLFSGWSGGLTAAAATATFTMSEGLSFAANFIPNPFLPVKGGYSGLLTGADAGSAGLIGLTLNSNGTVSGKVTIGAKTYSFTGKLAVNGTATIQIPRTGTTPLAVSLALDLTGGSGLSVTVNDGSRVLTAQSEQLLQAGTPAQVKGRYTVLIPPNPGAVDASIPQGNGYGTLVVNALGRATLIGSLADGRSFSRAGTVTSKAHLPVFISLYENQGFAAGQLTFRSTDVTDLDGTLAWVKPARPSDRYYPAGFATEVPVIGSLYTAPTAGTPVVSVKAGANNSALALEEGDLQVPVVQPLTLDDNNHVTATNPILPKLSVKISATTGIFSGSFVHPISGQTRALKGVIFQKQNAGYGFFLGIKESGYTSLAPAQ